MQTFLFPPTQPEASWSSIGESIGRIVEENPPLAEGMMRIHRILQEVFLFDYALLTYATEYREEEQYFLFPEVPGTEKIPLNSYREQLLVLRNGPKKVIRLGNQDDHGVTLGLISRIFPGSRFSVLVMRAILSQRLICSLSFIRLKKKSGFEHRHISLAFFLFDTLMSYYRRQARPARKRRVSLEDSRYLSVTELPGMKHVTDMIWQVARQQCPVLLLGESGTGKEVVAETLYRASARVDAPFLKINCGGIPDSLIDSELFGHEKGSFTGAVHTRKGVFERAHRGMLLLDEIGELPPAGQTRLLRILQDGVLERIGGSEEQQIDIRIIAATHRDLGRMVQEGRFRADLYFRLDVFPIVIPPLRERPEDIPFLVHFLTAQKCRQYWVQQIPSPSVQNMRELLAYSWPGNIRELNNAVERAVILWIADMRRPFSISVSDRFTPAQTALPAVLPRSASDKLQEGEKPESLDMAIIRHIQKALAYSKGKISGVGGAAEILGLHPNTLRAKMRKLGILP
ncbi:sigma-54-dependent Fis family transcriptional regulator [Mailhella massiliensis]|uniref:Sigma-54 dependent transcriptional regulator n=1 Tax=Mailhella massiliensis TaxID=1903261 RepID=A0A921AVF5_9BACT|nr:sigma-54 dependent transcriptional regulator [Mailhella massiliensis]HJD97065.1 sigma-54 dependent transcriptional regulator [Mailhella massiliensis]